MIRKFSKSKINLFFYFLLFIGLIFSHVGTISAFASSNTTTISFLEETSQTKKVLYLNSYSETHIITSPVLEGIRSVFENEQIVLDTEFMDTKRFPGEENLENFYHSFKYKLEHTYSYDAIIVSDDAALQFVIDHQEELFNQIPVFFIGINDQDRAYKAASNPYITGIFEKMTLVEDNINLALKINPDANKIIGFVDETITGQGDEKQFLELQDQYPTFDFEVIRSSEYSFEELGKKMEAFGDDTILILFTISVDKNLEYMNMNQQFSFVRDHTNIPVYRVSIAGVGSSGLLGGKMVDYNGIGVEAAETILRILNGENVSDIPLIETIPCYYIFDNNVLLKYEIDKDLLPEGSIILNEKISVFEQYRLYFVGAGIITFFLAVLVFILIIDNTKRRIIQKNLTDTNQELSILSQKYESAMNSTNSAIWQLNIKTMKMEVSENFFDIFSRKIPLHDNFYRIVEKLTEYQYQTQIANAIQKYIEEKKDEIDLFIPILDDKENRHWIFMRGNGIFDQDHHLLEIHGIFLDVTNERERQEYIAYYAKHDYLTGLPNRLDFEETLKKELDSSIPGALMLFDVDNFKSINDTMGHTFGDEILKQIATRLNKFSSDNFYISRMGGDEFLVLMKNVSKKEEVIAFIERVNHTISKPFTYMQIEEYISFSMGVALFPKDGKNINQLLMDVDTAMYYVKKNGKNNYEFYYEEMKTSLRKRKSLEKLIRNAVKKESFILNYQPQVDAQTGEIKSFEALIRMKNETVGPGTFIPIAEETGDIIEIGRWVVKEVLKQQRKWKDMGLETKKVAINYSTTQMNDRYFLDYLQAKTKEYGIAPSFIEIEITERILMEKTDLTLEFLQNIKNAGYSLSLDDFGSGYSSLSYLTFLPIDIIKLDKSINDKFLAMEDTQVMRSIISLAHGLNLQIVAEGIETKESFERIQACGCDCIQGYYFSKPLSVEEVEKIYTQHFTV